MADYDFQCLLCGEQFDGGVQHEPPERCPACDGPEDEIVRIEPTELIDDRKENEHDFDYLAGE